MTLEGWKLKALQSTKGTIMGNDKLALPKPSVTTSAAATPSGPPTVQVLKGEVAPVTLTAGLVKTVSDAIKSTSPTQGAANEIETLGNAADKKSKPAMAKPTEPSKMETATEIYKRMMQTKGMTRKEVLVEFVSTAKLSKAGASTYFQLIKAKG